MTQHPKMVSTGQLLEMETRRVKRPKRLIAEDTTVQVQSWGETPCGLESNSSTNFRGLTWTVSRQGSLNGRAYSCLVKFHLVTP